ncbi:MAG: stage III sporulation protein AE, partial [Oscillospiraceae bacterium]
MKKFIFIFMIFNLFNFNNIAFAQVDVGDFTKEVLFQETENIVTYNEEVDSLKGDVKKNLKDIIPKETEDILSSSSLTEDLLNEIGNFNIFNIFDIVIKQISNYVSKPLNIFVNIVVIILFTAIFYSFRDNFLKNSLKQVITYVSGICIITIISMPILELITNIKNVILAANQFMISFIPIFSSLLMASGKALSSAAYSSILFSVTQFTGFLIGNFLVPLLSVFFAFSISGAITSTFNILAITDSVKKIVTISLGVVITFFVSLLSLQSLITTSGDDLILKTSKFMVGNFIPVIGGALSDAVSSVYGYMSVFKNTVGVFGVIILILTFLPTFLQLISTYFFIYLSNIISDILDLKEIKLLLKAVLSTL